MGWYGGATVLSLCEKVAGLRPGLHAVNMCMCFNTNTHVRSSLNENALLSTCFKPDCFIMKISFHPFSESSLY